MEPNELTGFQTAGKHEPITVSRQALSNAKRKLEYDSFDEDDSSSSDSLPKRKPLSTQPEVNQNNSSSIKPDLYKLQSQASTSTQNNFSGFSTASNNPIYVDPESLQKARNKFCPDEMDEDWENLTQQITNSTSTKQTQQISTPLMNLQTVNFPESPVASVSQNYGKQGLTKNSKKGFVSPLNKNSPSSFSSPLLKNSPLTSISNPNPAKRRFSAPFRAPTFLTSSDNSNCKELMSPRITDIKKDETVFTPKSIPTISNNVSVSITKSESLKKQTAESSSERPLVVELCDLAQYAHRKIDLQGTIICIRIRRRSSPLFFELEDDWENTVRCEVFTKNEEEFISKMKLGVTVTIKGVFVKNVNENISLVVNDGSILSYV